MVGPSKPFIVVRNPPLVPKQRRIERLESGYAVQELCNDSEGRYWYVIVALEVTPGRRTSTAA